jgi:hypothetical protein
MNNDFYYLKYLKYKTKYLEEKNKIEGGGCDPNLAKQLEDINTLQYFNKIIVLIQSGDRKSIIDFVKERYINEVFTFLNLNKDCLAPQLLKYLQKKQIELVPELEIMIPKIEGPKGSFLNLKFTSLNIKEEPEGSFIPTIINDKKFSKGTAFIVQSVEKKNLIKGTYYELERNLRYLTNIMNIKVEIEQNIFIESLRFGTPYAPKKDDVEFYKTQVNILKEYVGSKTCLFISFLDICVNLFCKVDVKIAEQKTVEEELSGYNVDNFIYLNLPCNNGVNLKGSISGIKDDKLKIIINNNLTKLEKLMISPELIKLKNNFFEKLKKYVSDIDNSDPYLLKEL